MSPFLRPALALLGALSFLTPAEAQQVQTQCFTDSVVLQNTNWTSSVSLPKFDPNLGTLTGIQFQLAGNSTGSARAESLDASPSNVTLTFQNTISLTRPDNSVIVVAIPQAIFNDSLAVFDGTIDFAGTSGVSHMGLVANAVGNASSPPPAGDLALFTGVGNIVLPVTAVGNSTAVGSGNIISQFTSQAACDVQVCYQYLPNVPPAFTAPQCGTQLMASAGVLFQVQVCAADVDPNDVVTITAASLPAGAMVTPALPQSGNPVCVTVDWIPSALQAGVNTFTFTATDSRNRTTTCGFTVLVAECHVVFGLSTGNEQFAIFGHLYDTQLAQIRRTFPVTMEDNPAIRMASGQVIHAQVVMYNPQMFPTNASQWSRVCTVTMNPDQTISTHWSGTRNGITLRARTVQVGTETRVQFPFRIDGM
ncbi:MAG: choice-of-anchor E domain-containing protein [Planctomycetes bacterium]|nr:choice-of-anchor E domain-containing protein [Planctomycetota bacterium]